MPNDHCSSRPLGGIAPLAIALAILLSTSAAPPISAQAPGYPQLDPGSVRAEYVAEVLDRLNELLAEWGDSWATDQVDELADLYSEDAVLIPPDGTMIRGREAIRDYLAGALPDHGPMEAFMLDFDASGEMAQVFGNYSLDIREGGLADTRHQGPMITVYVRRSRNWRIRSQIFVPPAPTG